MFKYKSCLDEAKHEAEEIQRKCCEKQLSKIWEIETITRQKLRPQKVLKKKKLNEIKTDLIKKNL